MAFGNMTEYKLDMSLESSMFLIISIAFQSVIGSFANAFVILTILTLRELRNRSEDRLIVNLAVADIFALFTFLPYHAYFIHRRSIPVVEYKFYEPLNTLSVGHGGNAIFAIAIDRFVAILFPFRHKIVMTKNTTFSMALVSWLVAFGITVVQYLRLSSTMIPSQAWKVIALTYKGVQLIGMGILYAFIYATTVRQSRAIMKQRSAVGNATQNYHSRIVFKMTVTTLGLAALFYLTYLPLAIYIGYSWVHKLGLVRQSTDFSWIYSFLFFNSALNPFVYALRTRRFKAAFYKNIWQRSRLNTRASSSRFQTSIHSF